MSKNNTETKTTLLTARIEVSQLDRLDKLCEKYAIVRSRLVREALKRYLDLYDENSIDLITPAASED